MDDYHDGAMTDRRLGGVLSDAAQFAALAGAMLDRQPPQEMFDPAGAGAALGRGDWDLNPELRAEPVMQTLARPAAVLVPIIARDELSVLLTLRPDHLQVHPGQISFPGGKIELCDDGPADAALRETEEEVGLTRDLIEPLGFLDGYRTATGYRITPLVGMVRDGFTLKLDAREVVEVFEVPLRYLMDQANHQTHSRQWRGKVRYFYAISFQGRYIWGATAGIIRNLYERLCAG